MSPNAERCVSCGQMHEGLYCPACGEKRLEERDLSWRHFWSHAFEAFFHADGRIFRSLRTLIFMPGELTAAYMSGRRKPLLAPLSLFLVVNLIYFLVAPLAHWDTMVTPLKSHLTEQLYSAWVKPLVQHQLQARNESFDAYAAKFDYNVGVEAHALAIALVVLFFVPTAALLYRRRPRLLDHSVFSLHFCAFLLLWTFSTQIMTNLVMWVISKNTRGTYTDMDVPLSLVTLAGAAFYLWWAIRRLYGGSRLRLTAEALTLTLTLVPVLHAYRLILFFVAYYRVAHG